MKVRLLKNTPYGPPGKIIERSDKAFKAFVKDNPRAAVVLDAPKRSTVVVKPRAEKEVKKDAKPKPAAK